MEPFVIDTAPKPPLAQAAGAGNAPMFIAPEHASFIGGIPELQVVTHPPVAQLTQLILADQPGAVIDPSETKRIVKHPLVAV